MHWLLPISYLARATQPSWLGRHFLLAWHLVILATSLYPFSGWRFTGEPIFAFFSYPLPHYQTRLDNWLNLLAYLPLGYGWVLAFRCRAHAVLLALLFGGLLSGSIEFLQQFLPARVANNLDLLYNSAGALLGGVLAVLSHRFALLHAWHIRRQRWFRSGGLIDYGLVLLALWLLTQINPAVPLLGVVVQPAGLPQPWVSPIENAHLFLRALEASGVWLHATAVALMLSSVLAQRWQAKWVIAGWVLLALLIKVLTAGALLKPSEFLAWFNLNVLLGAAAAACVLPVLLRLKRRWQGLLALLCLLATLWVEYLWPLAGSPNGLAALFRWRYGHLRDFNGLSQTISEIWPYLAIVYLILLIRRDLRRANYPTVLGH